MSAKKIEAIYTIKLQVQQNLKWKLQIQQISLYHIVLYLSVG